MSDGHDIGDGSTPTVVLTESDDELGDVLREAQLALLRHPTVAQALLRAFLAEGRRFAETPAGRRWKRRLAGSDLVRRGQVAWERSSLGLLEEQSATVLPSMLLDAMVSALSTGELPPILGDRERRER
jgi:hypothetical protein